MGRKRAGIGQKGEPRNMRRTMQNKPNTQIGQVGQESFTPEYFRREDKVHKELDKPAHSTLVVANRPYRQSLGRSRVLRTCPQPAQEPAHESLWRRGEPPDR